MLTPSLVFAYWMRGSITLVPPRAPAPGCSILITLFYGPRTGSDDAAQQDGVVAP